MARALIFNKSRFSQQALLSIARLIKYLQVLVWIRQLIPIQQHDFKRRHVMVWRTKTITTCSQASHNQTMAYLIACLASESFAEESPQILCYYINNTPMTQTIRVVSGLKCHFERMVFSMERILFTTLQESCLEVYSPLIQQIRLETIDCKLLCINQNICISS